MTTHNDMRDNCDFEKTLKASLKHWSTPSEETRARMWHRACDQATEDASPPLITRLWRLAFVPVLMALLTIAFFGGYVGVVLAEGASLPGEPLYSIERRTENLWLSLTPRAQRCEVRLVLLDRRISEIEALLTADKPMTPGLPQEIDLLLQALGEEALGSPKTTGRALRSVQIYLQDLSELQARYPGVWELRNLVSTADDVHAQLDAAFSPVIP